MFETVGDGGGLPVTWLSELQAAAQATGILAQRGVDRVGPVKEREGDVGKSSRSDR